MPQLDAIYFDIAAVAIMVVTLVSLILRHMTRGVTNRICLWGMTIITITALASLGVGLVNSAVGAGILNLDPDAFGHSRTGSGALMLIYYALRSTTGPICLVLIASVSGTFHWLSRSVRISIFLWTPLAIVLLLTLTNPLHHLVYYYVDGIPQRGPCIGVLYVCSLFYAIAGMTWLIRWRSALDHYEFFTLFAVYPMVLLSVLAQFAFPALKIEMFVTSIAMMLISAFVIRPEKRLDSLVNAASLNAYRDMCRRAFITDKQLCLVYLEIVNLEQIREFVGTEELEYMVQSVSNNLSRTLERDDVLYYLRNGLFCISPRNIDPDHAEAIALKTHEEGMARSKANGEASRHMEMRICIVNVPDDAPDQETLKAFVRRFAHLVPNSCVTTFSKLSQHEDFELDMNLAEVVSQAIDRRSFSVYYQPIWCCSEGRFHSAEALVRLEDPRFGWVPPSLFIPEAEQNGSIVEIGSILLGKICEFLGRTDCTDIGLDFLEVNLSVDQCIRPAMAAELIETTERYGVEPSLMNLEVTETSSSYSQEAIAANVHTLSEAGFTFSLDDYGTGYSNILRMLSLPFSIVKFDKAFADAYKDSQMRTVLADTIATMRAIGKKTLIEGVETKEQADALVSLGIDYIQGYYYAKPLPEHEFIAFMREHS